MLNLLSLFLLRLKKLIKVLVFPHKHLSFFDKSKILFKPNILAILTVIKFLEYSIPFLKVVGP